MLALPHFPKNISQSTHTHTHTQFPYSLLPVAMGRCVDGVEVTIGIRTD